jgi:hypothetical protein
MASLFISLWAHRPHSHSATPVKIRGAASILALLVLAACSGDGSLSGSVSLEVRQRASTFYTEGSISYVHVEAIPTGPTKGGIVEKSKRHAPDGAVLAALSVPAGRITVMTWQRPCIGNCDHLDAPSDHCEVSFVAEEKAQVVVRTTYSAGRGCTVEVEGAEAQ